MFFNSSMKVLPCEFKKSVPKTAETGNNFSPWTFFLFGISAESLKIVQRIILLFGILFFKTIRELRMENLGINEKLRRWVFIVASSFRQIPRQKKRKWFLFLVWPGNGILPREKTSFWRRNCWPPTNWSRKLINWRRKFSRWTTVYRYTFRGLDAFFVRLKWFQVMMFEPFRINCCIISQEKEGQLTDMKKTNELLSNLSDEMKNYRDLQVKVPLLQKENQKLRYVFADQTVSFLTSAGFLFVLAFDLGQFVCSQGESGSGPCQWRQDCVAGGHDQAVWGAAVSLLRFGTGKWGAARPDGPVGLHGYHADPDEEARVRFVHATHSDRFFLSFFVPSHFFFSLRFFLLKKLLNIFRSFFPRGIQKLIDRVAELEAARKSSEDELSQKTQRYASCFPFHSSSWKNLMKDRLLAVCFNWLRTRKFCRKKWQSWSRNWNSPKISVLVWSNRIRKFWPNLHLSKRY